MAGALVSRWSDQRAWERASQLQENKRVWGRVGGGFVSGKRKETGRKGQKGSFKRMKTSAPKERGRERKYLDRSKYDLAT